MKDMGFLLVVLASIMFFIASGKTQDHNEGLQPSVRSVFETQYACRATGPESSLRNEDLTVLGLTIGKSTIRDVQERFAGTFSVKLSDEDGAEEGVCIMNEHGMAAVFATGVMGAPDTLVAIYLVPTSLVEKRQMRCKQFQLPSKLFASQSGLRVGATAAKITQVVHNKIPTDGSFCTAYQIASSRGPLQLSKGKTSKGGDFTDFTGAEGETEKGKLEWVKIFGIASD
jgi:hypothetical protein